MSAIKIVPSVLPADQANLGEAVAALEKAGVDRAQWDVMDGRFVPNLTFGPDVIAAARSYASLPFEAHLMVVEPEAMLARYVEAGCQLVIVHAESTRHLHRTLGQVAEAGARVGVALNPATPVSTVRHVVDLVDLVLVMTVNPGFGGQAYIETMEPKIAEVAELVAGLSGPAGEPVEIEVDGGISTRTVQGAVAAGARALVAGTGLYSDPLGLEHAVKELRSRAEAALR